MSFRTPTTFPDALSFAREKEIDVTHILFHHDRPAAGRGGIAVPNGSDTDSSEMDELMASVRAKLIRDFEESKERKGPAWSDENERQLADIKAAIHCATGLQAYIDGGRELGSVRADSRVASVSRLAPFSVVASGEISPEDFEDCVDATLDARSGSSQAVAQGARGRGTVRRTGTVGVALTDMNITSRQHVNGKIAGRRRGLIRGGTLNLQMSSDRIGSPRGRVSLLSPTESMRERRCE